MYIIFLLHTINDSYVKTLSLNKYDLSYGFRKSVGLLV